MSTSTATAYWGMRAEDRSVLLSSREFDVGRRPPTLEHNINIYWYWDSPRSEGVIELE